MNQIRITTDSAADLPDDILERYNIETVPLYINTESGSYKDMIDFKPDDVFKYYQETKALTKTSAATINDYLELFMPIVGSGDQVIHINLGSEISACYQNACMAAKEFPEGSVYVIDSHNVSSGIAFCAVAAGELVRRGRTAQYIIDMLNDSIVSRVETSFIADNLTYLHAGGRCSSVAKLGANLLKIKPCIDLENGKMHVGKKYRGAWPKCVNQYIDEKLSNRNDINKHAIFVAHSPCSDEVINEVKRKLKDEHHFEEIIDASTSCTISSHCGPNALGIIFLRNR